MLDVLFRKLLKVGNPISFRLKKERLQPLSLLLVVGGGHNQLAAFFVWHVVILTELVEELPALHAKSCFEGEVGGRVVDPCVYDLFGWVGRGDRDGSNELGVWVGGWVGGWDGPRCCGRKSACQRFWLHPPLGRRGLVWPRPVRWRGPPPRRRRPARRR